MTSAQQIGVRVSSNMYGSKDKVQLVCEPDVLEQGEAPSEALVLDWRTSSHETDSKSKPTEEAAHAVQEESLFTVQEVEDAPVLRTRQS